MFNIILEGLVRFAIQATIDHVTDSICNSGCSGNGSSGKLTAQKEESKGVWRQVDTKWNPKTRKMEGGHPVFFKNKDS